ncbi:MAG TPA: hypothetical protein VFF68_07645 [Anaerolineaceae bacterium]|nr:hypothetical protein [Anaerolineaceae bacterium]
MSDSSITTYAFIDSQNLNLSVKKDLFHPRTGKQIYRGWRLDFKHFFNYLQDKYRVEKAFLFIGRVEGQDEQYRYLQSAGYSLIFKPTLVH